MSRSSHPTLAELEGRVHKQRHREIGNWLARRVGRPSAVYGTWLAIRLGLSAHQVTVGALAASFASAVAIGSGTRAGFIGGVVLGHLAFWLDHVDGQVARWRGTASLDGVFLDYLLHHAANLTLGFALGYGLAARSGDTVWALAGFSIAAGWLFLGLSNDCRYKAIFQRLKREGASYRVDGGAGGRPAPPAPWPRRGIGMITWPAYKICESHCILLVLTLFAFVAVFWPLFWESCWVWSTVGMALLAPTLAVGRLARLVRRGAVEAEFARWFRPTDPDVR